MHYIFEEQKIPHTSSHENKNKINKDAEKKNRIALSNVLASKT